MTIVFLVSNHNITHSAKLMTKFTRRTISLSSDIMSDVGCTCIDFIMQYNVLHIIIITTLSFQNVMQRMGKVNSPQNTVQLLVYDTRTTAP